MSRQGRPPAWNHEERDRVVALAAEGFSQRQIAVRVFGEERLRGRVERIFAASAERAAPARPG